MSSVTTLHRPEILAPAGSPEALEAALHAGADAVYFGLQDFNARARAHNFSADTLPETLAHIHAAGARGYVTLNTLLFDHELPAMESTLRRAAEAGVDAIIVQDLGVARMAAAIAPNLPIHASTQMTCTDADAVMLAAELGARRVVVARELGITEIRAIAERTHVELEVFVHGALCVAYSGQCLTSEAIGGRSANRGACAQACRLPYDAIVDGERRSWPERRYLLSPQDLEASELVPRLIEAGVRSFKIEGRLKGPDYVAATVRLYRAAIAHALARPDDPEHTTHPLEPLRKQALQVFSRGSGPGFLAGVDHQRLVEGRTCGHRGLELGDVLALETRGHGHTWLRVRPACALARGDGVLFEPGPHGEELGGRIWALHHDGRDVESTPANIDVWLWLGPDKDVRDVTVGRRLYKNGDPRVSRALARAERERVALSITVRGEIGEPLVLEAEDERGHRASVSSEATLQQAHAGGLDRDRLADKLGRLGDSPYRLAHLTPLLAPRAMLPPSELNRMRRALVQALLAASHATPHMTTPCTTATLVSAAARHTAAPPPPGLFVLCRNVVQAEAALTAGADGVYLDFLELQGTGPALRALRARFSAMIGVCPPRIRKPGEDKIDRYLAQQGPDVYLVRTLGGLRSLPSGIPCIGDFSLNISNALSAQWLLSRGLVAFTPAHDLDADQLVALLARGLAPHAEVVVHHAMPFFHMEHCLFAALLSDGADFRTCGRPCERHTLSLRDRVGAEHAVIADVGCRNTVFRGAPQSAADRVHALAELGTRRLRIECVHETAAQVHALVTGYRALWDGTITSAELKRKLTESGQRPVQGSLHVLA